MILKDPEKVRKSAAADFTENEKAYNSLFEKQHRAIKTAKMKTFAEFLLHCLKSAAFYCMI